jgi:hypothetical protein
MQSITSHIHTERDNIHTEGHGDNQDLILLHHHSTSRQHGNGSRPGGKGFKNASVPQRLLGLPPRRRGKMSWYFHVLQQEQIRDMLRGTHNR